MSKSEKTVRVDKLAVIPTPETRQRLTAIAKEIQQVVNDYHAHWLRLHYEAGNHIKVREWIAADRKWAKTPVAERPIGKRIPCPVRSISNEMARKLYNLVTKQHGTLGTKPVGLAIQKCSKRLMSGKATKSAYPRWMIILAGEGEYPSSSNPYPIPFYTSNSRLIVPETIDGEWKIEVRFELPGDGGKRLVPHVMPIRTKGRKLAKLRNTLWQIAKGEWKFCASDLVCRDGLWYAHIGYQIPKPPVPNLDTKKVAVLYPGSRHPIILRIAGRSKWLGRYGNDVAYLRKSLCGQRRSKAEAYRDASSARKGHGRGRALAWRAKLTRRWQDFVKTWNGQLASAVIRDCVANGYGTLVVCQPCGDWRSTRFLASTGARRNDESSWDWYQMASLLSRQGQEFGVDVIQRRVGEGNTSMPKQTQANAKKQLTGGGLQETLV